MKVGVDAVLIGAWAGVNPKSVLDVGTGCGIISLILAQRFNRASITGIDIDPSSIKEASENFFLSPWKTRLKSSLMKFPDGILGTKEKYDLIVSNPPYFRSGVCPKTQREVARHQDSLSLFKILEFSPNFLNKGGRISLIFPSEFEEEALLSSVKNHLYLLRKCYIRNNKNKPYKRVMMEFSDNEEEICEIERLTLFSDKENLNPTEEYKALCGNLYLKF